MGTEERCEKVYTVSAMFRGLARVLGANLPGWERQGRGRKEGGGVRTWLSGFQGAHVNFAYLECFRGGFTSHEEGRDK